MHEALPRTLCSFACVYLLRRVLLLELALLFTFALFILAVGFVVWMMRDLLREHRDHAANAAKPAVELGRLAVEVLTRAIGLVPIVIETLIGYTFIYFWLMRYRVKSILARYATIVFLSAGILGMFEKLLKLGDAPVMASFLEHHQKIAAIADGLDSFFEYPGTWVTLILIEAFLIRHHLHEPAHHHHERTTLAVLNEALHPLSVLNTELGRTDLTDKTREEMEETYWDILSQSMSRLMRERRVPDLNVSIMPWDNARGCLWVRYENDPHRFDHSFILASGEGAAGRALKDNISVYIPVIRYRHAVALVPKGDGSIGMRILLDVYKPSDHPFKAMLAVPISSQGAVVGILNFSSSRKSAFKGSDFNVADLTAVILGLMNRKA